MLDRPLHLGRSSARAAGRSSLARRRPGRAIGTLLLASALGLAAGATGACKGKKTTDPAVCMNQCESECPYKPDSQGGNDDYIECVEACTTQCTG